MPTLPRASRRVDSVLAILALAACGRAAARGLPRLSAGPGDDDQGRSRKTLPAAYEYVGQTTGSKEVEVRARVTGILEQEALPGRRAGEGGPDAVRHRSASRWRRRPPRSKPKWSRAQAQKAQADRELARLKPLAEKRAVGQKEADDAQSNVELAAAAVRVGAGAARRNQAEPRLHERDGADRRPVEPRAQVRRQPRHRQRHAADDDLAGRPDVDPVHDLRERAARAQQGGRRKAA